MDVPVKVLGDCSYAYILDAKDQRDFAARLAFYLFGYLVPRELLFDEEYLRFRISNPTEEQIVARHLRAYGVRFDLQPQRSDRNVWDMIDMALNHASQDR